MVLFNYSTKELTAKVVYYGPGLCGKTTNLQWIHEKLPIKNKGKMLSLATETDRTLFFDFLPIELGTIRGMRTRIQLYTVPGQVFYNATRRMVLKGADCVVFVVDSQEPMLEANAESLENLRENLEVNEIDADEIPMVIQYNKRDLPNALPIEILNERLNPRGRPHHEAVAVKGLGVEETLKGVTALVFRSLASKYGGPEAATPPPARVSAAQASTPAPAPPSSASTAPAVPPGIPPVKPQPPRPALNLQPAEPADELLGSLHLEPAADAGGDLDLGLGAAHEPHVEELPVVEEELSFDGPPAGAAQAVSPRAERADPKATLVRSADEAADLRRRIQRPVSAELQPEPQVEALDDLHLEPEPQRVAPEPAASEEFEISIPDEEPAVAAPPPAPRRPGSETIPPFAVPPAGDVGLAPVAVDVPSDGGPVELTLPVELRLADGSRTSVQLRLTLAVRVRG